jgi:hypothetical protein
MIEDHTYGGYLRACQDNDIGYLRSVRHLLIDGANVPYILYDAAIFGTGDVFYYMLTVTRETRKDITGLPVATLFTLLLNDNRVEQCKMVADILMNENYIPWLRDRENKTDPDSRGFLIYSIIIDRLSAKKNR